MNEKNVQRLIPRLSILIIGADHAGKVPWNQEH
jgi:hypothetical protein